MTLETPLRPSILFGFVPTHVKFVGGLVPDDTGRLPRDGDGTLMVVAEAARILRQSPAKPNCIQIPHFTGTADQDVVEMVTAVRGLGFEAQLVLMVGGGDPMNPADEDAVAAALVAGLRTAADLGISEVSSTSIEQWMKPGAARLEGTDFDAAVAQNVKLHLRAYQEAGLAESSVKTWHIEFLRPGEFQTFTDLGRLAVFVRAANKALGHVFFKTLVDAAHCGDSGLSMEQNISIIEDLAGTGEFGIFHASAKTTRGCLSTDDGWIPVLLTAAARTGQLRSVFVEMFHHEDVALEGLRQLDPHHGVDTSGGRTYSQVVMDGLLDITRRLNHLTRQGYLNP
jgi:hypothetical protein